MGGSHANAVDRSKGFKYSVGSECTSCTVFAFATVNSREVAGMVSRFHRSGGNRDYKEFPPVVVCFSRGATPEVKICPNLRKDTLTVLVRLLRCHSEPDEAPRLGRMRNTNTSRRHRIR